MQIICCNLEDYRLFRTKLDKYFYVYINLKDSRGISFTNMAFLYE